MSGKKRQIARAVERGKKLAAEKALDTAENRARGERTIGAVCVLNAILEELDDDAPFAAALLAAVQGAKIGETHEITASKVAAYRQVLENEPKLLEAIAEFRLPEQLRGILFQKEGARRGHGNRDDLGGDGREPEAAREGAEEGARDEGASASRDPASGDREGPRDDSG